MNKMVALIPGLLWCVVAVAISLFVNSRVPLLSALLVAILLGVVAGNVGLPESTDPGLKFAAKPLLRTGIVLLGLQLALGDILALGAGMIAVVIMVVVLGMFSTYWVARRMGMSENQSILMGAGVSICGAAAVAAAGDAQDADEDDVATALAMVVLYGTIMIPLLPLLAQLFGLSTQTTGLWAGASVHEVAQVVAIGGSLGPAALSAAVVVKLARVMMLAPVMAVLAWRRRRLAANAHTKLPPIIPLWVALFIAMVAVRALGIIPDGVLAATKMVQTALLAAAMFALGTGVKVSIVKKVGGTPLVIGAISTAIVGAVGLVGVLVAA